MDTSCLGKFSLLVLSLALLVLAACARDEGSSGESPTVDGSAVLSEPAASYSATSPVSRAPLDPTATPKPPTATPAPTGRVVLNAVGDLMLARDIITLMDENGSVYPFAAVRDILAAADVTVANMEGTFTDRGVAADKFYTFRTPPGHAQGLAEAGIDIVSLGNNHAMDFGAEGLADTLASLDAAGVVHTGAGMSEDEARRPVFVEANGLKLAFLSYNSAALTEAFPAGPSSPGVALADEDAIRDDVAAVLQGADLVIVSLHAGVEYTDAPSPQQRLLAEAAVEAGAAVVLGHHAHVLQGWEHRGKALIAWGLGNFVFDLDFDDLETLGPRPFQSVVLSIELARDGVQSVTPHPVYIDPAQNRPVQADGELREAIEARIEQLNAALP